MGQTGFCENLRFPAVCCENLRPRSAVIPRKSENLQKSARICEKTANSARFVPFSLSLLLPLDFFFAATREGQGRTALQRQNLLLMFENLEKRWIL